MRQLSSWLAMPVLSALFMLSLGNEICAVERTVPGLNQLVVLDPGRHEQGLPAIDLREVEGGIKVDIPPKVHVHRYYYSGDMEYQAKILEGGPTVIVAKHPTTGQQMYVDAVLPSGAPKIAYNKHGITYVYSDRRVCIKFHNFPFDTNKATVKHESGRGFARATHEFTKKVADHAAQKSHGWGHSLDGVKSTFSQIPGIRHLCDYAKGHDKRVHDNQIKAATNRLKREETEFIPTIR